MCSIFSNSSIILPRLRALIGVRCSYSGHPFLCTLVTNYSYSSANSPVWLGESILMRSMQVPSSVQILIQVHHEKLILCESLAPQD